MSFDHGAYVAELVAATDHDKARALALRLHWAFDTAAGAGHELNCYTCATWPDPNDPGRDPGPADDCWLLAAEILREEG
jgi:hypothetical protein